MILYIRQVLTQKNLVSSPHHVQPLLVKAAQSDNQRLYPVVPRKRRKIGWSECQGPIGTNVNLSFRIEQLFMDILSHPGHGKSQVGLSIKKGNWTNSM